MPSDEPLRIAYMVGTGRSGSTLMSLLMDTHPRLASVGEVSPNRRHQRDDPASLLCSCHLRLDACPFWQKVFARVQQNGFDFSARQWTNDYRHRNSLMHHFFDGYSHVRFVHALQRMAPSILPFYRGSVRRINRVNVAFIRAVLEIKGADVFCDASKNLVRLDHFLGIEALDVRVVRLIRDVRAYVRSVKRKGASASEGARTWRHFQTTANRVLAQLPPDRLFCLKYEEFCRDPQEWMGRLCEFLNVEPASLPEKIYPQQHHVIGNRMRLEDTHQICLNEKWRTDLSPNEQEVALRVAGDVNLQFGYAA